MNPELRQDILERLQRDHKAVASSNYLNKIECPSCNKREAFTELEKPWVVKCGRENKCGDTHHAKELFPELFETWTERYTPKEPVERQKNPTAVADGYLRDGRGFDLERIRGWYTQEYFHDHRINAGTTTVRFPLPNGHWERLLDKPQRFGKQKANFVGNYKGLAWVPPVLGMAELIEAKEIWVTEGIFNSIALLHVGIFSISNMSSANYIDGFLAQLAAACKAADKKRPVIIWALDNDRAGQKYTLRHSAAAEAAGWQCGAAQAPGKSDWNDLLQLDRLGSKNIDYYLYLGDLLLAKTPGEKALLMYQRRERREFWFDYDAKLWWWKLDMDAYDRELRALDCDNAGMLSSDQRERLLKSAGVVTCVCSALPRPLYFMANRITDEAWYYFRIEMPDGSVQKHPFTPKQMTSSTEFKSRMLAIKNAWWIGTGKQLDRIMQDMMNQLKTVETIDFVGYSKEHRAYVFNDVAIREGKVAPINDEDYFMFGKLSLKTLASAPELHINTDLNQYNSEWPHYISRAFGSAGVVATAFWLGSLFAEQIRGRHKSYPFFELVGKAGAGKSTLLEFLWKTCGRADYEGFDPSKATLPARSRSFAQVSNLPVALIESDREQDSKQRQFDWDELKTAFNGRAIRSRGVKNNGNDTYEPPFRGAIVISQNAPVEASEAILSRIVHITLTPEHQSAQTKTAAEWLERVPMEQVSGFLLTATRAEKPLMELFDLQAEHYERLLLDMDEIRMIRIAKCHAQLLALIECLSERGLGLLPEPIIAEARQFVVDMAKARQAALNSDHPMISEFWDAFDYIEGAGADLRLNHYGPDARQIAVNLKEFERWCGEYKLRPLDMRQIKQLLRSSKARKFIDANRSVHSKITAKTAKCWIFENPKG
ncbi:toprim domain-containing protein [Marinobacterium sedimentorum]|uniref:toprim domain-containing protein n=1 Tax=Marinobacterium sedimentorum TaxID=2927804 RepID=UPI0020C68709|nr:toprim domain-containing protein [Marinobacterium sedimentorum]MCP8687727.1 toprim domain-containing protein [Marinobacterium sedimentorum]